jgi:hypothetical protein
VTEPEQRPDGVTDDRRTKPGAHPDEDPRTVDAEYASPEILETWRRQDGMVHPEPGETGLGASSDTAPGKDLPHDADPTQGER